MSTYDDKLEAAHTERDQILGRLAEAFNRMRLAAPPAVTPFTSESSAAALAEAARSALADGDTQPLAEALGLAQRPEGTDYSDLTTPVVVISLQGLRNLEGIVSELEQRRGEA